MIMVGGIQAGLESGRLLLKRLRGGSFEFLVLPRAVLPFSGKLPTARPPPGPHKAFRFDIAWHRGG